MRQVGGILGNVDVPLPVNHSGQRIHCRGRPFRNRNRPPRIHPVLQIPNHNVGSKAALFSTVIPHTGVRHHLTLWQHHVLKLQRRHQLEFNYMACLFCFPANVVDVHHLRSGRIGKSCGKHPPPRESGPNEVLVVAKQGSEGSGNIRERRFRSWKRLSRKFKPGDLDRKGSVGLAIELNCGIRIICSGMEIHRRRVELREIQLKQFQQRIGRKFAGFRYIACANHRSNTSSKVAEIVWLLCD